MDRSTSELSAREKLQETVRAARGDGERATAKIGSSALLVRLASKLGVGVNDLSMRLPADTIRKTKYPMLEEKQSDGTIKYTQPVTITEGAMTK